MLFGVVTFSGLAAVCVVALLIGLRPGAREKYSARWIAERNAPISPEIRCEVENARWYVRTGLFLGGLLGTLMVIPSVATFDPSEDSSMAAHLAVLILPLMLTVVGAGIGGLLAVFPAVRGPIRVAYPQAPKLTDSVHRSGLIVMRIQIGILLVGSLAATRYSTWTGTDFESRDYALLWAAAIGMVAVWAGTELVARRLIIAPLPSGDAATLFWRETLRGDLLRQIFRLPASLGYLAPLLITETLPRSFGTPAAGIGPTITFVFSVTVIALTLVCQILFSLVPESQRRTALLQAAQLENA